MAVDWLHRLRRGSEARDIRREMIEQTNQFLSWALADGRRLPRIPTSRVDRGGFSAQMERPEARAMVAYWWIRVLTDGRIQDGAGEE